MSRMAGWVSDHETNSSQFGNSPPTALPEALKCYCFLLRRQAQSVPELQEEEFDFLLRASFRVPVASLQYLNQFRTIGGAFFKIGTCQLLPSAGNLTAQKTARNRTILMRHSDSLTEEHRSQTTKQAGGA